MALVDFRGGDALLHFPPRKLVSNADPESTPHQLRQHPNRHVPELPYSPSTTTKQPIISPSSVYAPGNSRKPAPLNLTSPTCSSPPQQKNSMNVNRRTPSTSTTSTAHTNFIPTRTPSNVSNLSRTASSRSAASFTPASYVALMRKQKATVWCDRAQYEDPRMQAQQKAARLRAAREVSGTNMEGRNSTGSMGSVGAGVRSKIRHHGVPKASGYNYANPAGGGVPMRLSASEVGDDGNEVLDETESAWNPANYHQRTNSGRSSSGGGTNKWLAAAPVGPRPPGGRYSQGSSRTSGGASTSQVDIPELEETPSDGDSHNQHAPSGGGYFQPRINSGDPGSSDSSSELESGFGQVGQMTGPTVTRDLAKRVEDLRRRGSVDERSNTMGGLGGGKLFVANPD